VVRYDVDTGGMRTHASSLAGIAGQVRDSHSAASTTLDASAFGVVNGFLASAATAVCGGISTAIDRRAEDIQEVVATLRTMATNHDTTDEGARQRIEGAGR
jgi:hypothetical protein